MALDLFGFGSVLGAGLQYLSGREANRTNERLHAESIRAQSISGRVKDGLTVGVNPIFSAGASTGGASQSVRNAAEYAPASARVVSEIMANRARAKHDASIARLNNQDAKAYDAATEATGVPLGRTSSANITGAGAVAGKGAGSIISAGRNLLAKRFPGMFGGGAKYATNPRAFWTPIPRSHPAYGRVRGGGRPPQYRRGKGAF
jgi:hypothetical protein